MLMVLLIVGLTFIGACGFPNAVCTGTPKEFLCVALIIALVTPIFGAVVAKAVVPMVKRNLKALEEASMGKFFFSILWIALVIGAFGFYQLLIADIIVDGFSINLYGKIVVNMATFGMLWLMD